MRILQKHWFTFTLLAAMLAAALRPGWGEALSLGGWLRSGAIVAIFLVMGLTLKTRALIGGVADWRLHLFVQLTSFGLIPLMVWALLLPLRDTLPQGLVIGFYLWASLPTTITSCVVFTQLARGKAAAALFNAVAGNIGGLLLTPALVVTMIGTGGFDVELEIWAVFARLGKLVILPLMLGQLLRLVLREDWLTRFSSRAPHINSLLVIWIVYLSFAHAFNAAGLEGAWTAYLLPLLALIPFHGMLLGGIWVVTDRLGFARESRIAALFCAPQKTLALGLPMAVTCFAQRPELLAAVALPMIAYHPLQLIVASVLAQRLHAFSGEKS